MVIRVWSFPSGLRRSRIDRRASLTAQVAPQLLSITSVSLDNISLNRGFSPSSADLLVQTLGGRTGLSGFSSLHVGSGVTVTQVWSPAR